MSTIFDLQDEEGDGDTKQRARRPHDSNYNFFIFLKNKSTFFKTSFTHDSDVQATCERRYRHSGLALRIAEHALYDLLAGRAGSHTREELWPQRKRLREAQRGRL